MEIYKKLIGMQNKLKAPKNQHNSYGGFDYRSCEDIFNAVKPLLKDNELTLIMTDDLVLIGERYYIKSTATLTDGEETITNVAFAREEEIKKGMDGSQITGSASSYARKYALNGLFLIDDVKDTDGNDESSEGKERIKMINRINELELQYNIDHEITLDFLKVDTLNKATNSQLALCIKKMEKARVK